jgi:hypothetical protein
VERLVVLSVDEVSVLIGLLDSRWAGNPRAGPFLADMAQKYEQLLWTRLVEAPELDDVVRLRARNEELLAAVKAAIEVVGSDGPLVPRPGDDPDLSDLRALLSTVAVA